MVSFQCDGCGDVQTKKKLDSHWSRCHATFTCIDCMTTFYGTDYRSHTACMTEDQKYQGHLYREKPNKAVKRKSVSIVEPHENNALVPRKPTVEDYVEEAVPPAVPTPPPAVPDMTGANVFDFMVDEENANTPKITFATEREEMLIKTGAPSIFKSNRSEFKEELEHSRGYEENGYSYGSGPVKSIPGEHNASAIDLHDFKTPSVKNRASYGIPESAGHSRNNSNSEKKRKRAQTEGQFGDIAMPDAPGTIVRSVVETPGVAHSGLTGGLQRMVTSDDNKFSYPQTPALSPNVHDHTLVKVKSTKPTSTKDQQYHEDPQSPLKKTRRSKDDDANGLGISIKGRAGKVMSMLNSVLPANGSENTARRRGSSSAEGGSQSREIRGQESERRERKKHKVSRHNGTSRDNVRIEHKKSSSRRREDSESPDMSRSRSKSSATKRIEFHQHGSASDTEDDRRRSRGQNGEMVVFGAEQALQRKCGEFLEYVDKGQDSRGYSMNKVLKRWHKDSDIRRESEKHEEEKELWKGLRLRRNDRGEVVVFFA